MRMRPIILAFAIGITQLYSTSSNWIDPTTPGNWSTAANWNPATVPSSSGDTATLANGGTTPNIAKTVTVDTAETVGTLNIDNGYAYTVAGAASLTLQDPSNTATISITSANGTALHSITCPITLASNLTINQASATAAGAFSISNVISGSPSLTLTGGGALTLSGVNTYQGGTIINQGTLSVASDGNLGLSNTTITIGAGTLKVTASPLSTSRPFSLTGAATIDIATGTTTLSGPISGTGSLTLVDSGTLVLANSTNSYQGGTTISAGTLSISADSNLGNTSGTLTIGPGTLLLTSASFSSARPVTVSGQAIISTNTTGNTDTFSGAIGGGGSLTVTGGGTVILTGNNQYSGGTTVDTSTTLQGSTQSLQGNIQLKASSTLLFAQSNSGSYAGSLSSAASGNGTLTIQGSGALTFSGNNTSFSGATYITQGSLAITGSMLNSAITVSSGATLAGTGSVGAVISNSGILAPGATGLAIHGNLTLNGTSNLTTQITPTSASLLTVTGSASLTGASVTVAPAAGFYGVNSCYTILSSAGLGGTQFTSVTSTSSNFIPSLSYTADQVALCVQITNPFFEFPFANQNTQSVGNNLTALSLANELSPSLTTILDSLIGESFTTINTALNQMHPAPYSAFSELQEEIGAQIITLFHRKPILSDICCRSTRLWVKPFGDSLTEKNHGEEFGFTANSGGLALGLDGQVSSRGTLGIGAAWNNGHLQWKNGHGHGEVNSILGSLYSDWQLDNLYLGAAVYAGIDYFDTTRHIRILNVNDKAQAHFQGLDIAAQASVAYFFGAPTAYIYPYANFDFLYFNTRSFHEHGAGGLNLNVQKHVASTFRTEMGLALQVIDLNGTETLAISPLFSLGWVNMCPIERQNYHSTFAGASIPFSSYGWDQTWNLLSLDFGLGIYYCCFSLDLRYNVEMSADKHTLLYNHFGNLRLDWKW